MPSPFRSASRTAPGASTPVAWLPMTWGLVEFWLGGAVDDRDLVERLVGEDEVEDAVAGEVGDGQGDGRLDRLEGAEGAVAVADEDQHVAVGVADQEVELAVAQEVGDGQPGGIDAGVVGHRGREAALAVAQIDAHAVGGEDGQVGDAVAD